MRTIKELYNLLYEYYQTYQSVEYLCNAISYMKRGIYTDIPLITEEEYDILIDHFMNQYPSTSNYTEIYNNPLFNKHIRFNFNKSTGVWFNGGLKEGREIRIEFLEAILLKLA